MSNQAYIRMKKNKKIYQEAIKFCKEKKGHKFKARESSYPLVGREISNILNQNASLIPNNTTVYKNSLIFNFSLLN